MEEPVKEEVSSQVLEQNGDQQVDKLFGVVGLIIKILLVGLFAWLGVYLSRFGGWLMLVCWGISGVIAVVRPVIGVIVAVLVVVAFYAILAALMNGAYMRL